MFKSKILYLIPPVLSLATGYTLALVSILRGKPHRERVMLALICVWWTLISWVFVAHVVFTDLSLVLRVERAVHTLYIFAPAVSLLFFQMITGFKNRTVLYSAFITAAAFEPFVHTGYYISGFHHYSWGIIAKGGPAFSLFALYGTLVTFYIFYLFIKKLRTEKNKVVRLKINYLFVSYFLSVILTLSNLPAINGIGTYPLSNFIFIPLAILTYGILRYRLIEISSVLHMAIIWVVLSSVVVLPNLLIFFYIGEMYSQLDKWVLMAVFIVWFTANYYYFRKIQPLINSVMNRRNYLIRKTEQMFIRDIASLRNLDELTREVVAVLKETLNLSRVELFLCTITPGVYCDSSDEVIRLDLGTAAMLGNYEYPLIQKSMLESQKNPAGTLPGLLSLLEGRNSEYLVPLTNQDELIALIFLSEKEDRRQFNVHESAFISQIRAYAGIALANSVMYQNLSDIKDHLELIVDERTYVIEKQKYELEKDIQFARKIQLSLLPKNIPRLDNLSIAYRYKPFLGVGGDFIDIHYREGMGDIGLFICDVSGHGASSAMIASMVKMSLESWGSFMQKPSETFLHMKRLLSGKIDDNFISAFICTINLVSGEITAACAGHPPMIILRKNGETVLIKPPGKIIMDYGDSVYREVKTKLYAGDLVVLYTDGVIEAHSPTGEMIGDERFIAMLRRHAGASPEELCRKIDDEIFCSASDRVIDDDFTLLVAEYRGE